MELSKLYQAILASLNVTADKDGLLSLDYGGNETFPATVEGKRLVLPTPEILKRGLGENLIAFHPLSENILRGESAVLKKTKAYVVTRLTQVLSDLFLGLIGIAVDHKRHSKLSPDQKDLLTTMPDADEKTYQAVEKIFEAMQANGRYKLLSIYLNRGGKLRMEKYARSAVVNFPILSEFENEDGTVYGVKCRKKDFAGLHKLFEFILPNSDGSAYSYGSNDPEAPFFDALVHAFLNVANQLNKITLQFKKHLENANELLIDTSWAASENLNWKKYRGMIPVLEGNEGLTTSEEMQETAQPEATSVRRFDPTKAAAAAAASDARASHPEQPRGGMGPGPQNANVDPNKPVVRQTANGLNWKDLVDAQQRRFLPQGSTYNPTPVPHYQFAPANPQPAPGIAPGPMPPGYGPDPRMAPAPMVDPYGRPVDQYGRPLPMPVAGYGYPNAALPPGFAPPGYTPDNRGPSFGPAAPGYYPNNFGPAYGPRERSASFAPNANPGYGYGYPAPGYGYPNNLPPGFGNPTPPPGYPNYPAGMYQGGAGSVPVNRY